MTNDRLQAAPPRSTGRKIMVATAIVLTAGAAVLYGMMGVGGKETSIQCASSTELARRLAPLATGAVAALTIPGTPKPAIDVVFDGPSGEKKSLKDFAGKAVVLNLWATWCVPCREEMPSLDKLQARMGGADFEVVAVSIDTARLEKRRTFLDEAGVTRLVFYSDASADIFQRLKRAGKVLGLPTTLVIDKAGCEIGLMAGPAAWDSDDAIRLVTALKSS